jgi:hypothetical protein
MLRPFNCSPTAVRVAFVFFVICRMAFAQSPPPLETIKKDVRSVQNAVDQTINLVVPNGFGLLQDAKGAYLEGYGIVVNVEIALERPRNPFSGVQTAGEIRTAVNARRKELTEKMSEFLKQKIATLDSLEPSESVAVIINLLNTNPADLPDLPTQIVFSLKKQDAQSGLVSVREYK